MKSYFDIRVTVGTYVKNIITKKFLRIPRTVVVQAWSRGSGYVFERAGNKYYVPASKVMVISTVRSYGGKATWYQWVGGRIEKAGRNLGTTFDQLGTILRSLNKTARVASGPDRQKANVAFVKVKRGRELLDEAMNVIITAQGVLDG